MEIKGGPGSQEGLSGRGLAIDRARNVLHHFGHVLNSQEKQGLSRPSSAGSLAGMNSRHASRNASRNALAEAGGLVLVLSMRQGKEQSEKETSTERANPSLATSSA